VPNHALTAGFVVGDIVGGYLIVKVSRTAGCCVLGISLAGTLASIANTWSTATNLAAQLDHMKDYYECCNIAGGGDPRNGGDPRCLDMR
jgi:hypothetical protein